MAAIEIKINPEIGNHSGVIVLDGVNYQFSINWNSIDLRWYLDLTSIDGSPLLSGIAVAVNAPMLAGFAGPLLPPGELLAVDSSQSGSDVLLHDDLGNRVKLIYVPMADLL
jgi:hypothetical protein